MVSVKVESNRRKESYKGGINEILGTEKTAERQMRKMAKKFNWIDRRIKHRIERIKKENGRE